MTEVEKIIINKKEILLYRDIGTGLYRFSKDAVEILLQAFEEVEQYRAIGTIEDINKALNLGLKAQAELMNYQKIGTVEEFKALKDAEEQGVLLRLPYNIATCGVVYYVDETEREIYRLKADKIEIYKMMISNKFVYTIDCYDFFYEDFGKIVFTTKEEAEQALAEISET